MLVVAFAGRFATDEDRSCTAVLFFAVYVPMFPVLSLPISAIFAQLMLAIYANGMLVLSMIVNLAAAMPSYCLTLLRLPCRRVCITFF